MMRCYPAKWTFHLPPRHGAGREASRDNCSFRRSLSISSTPREVWMIWQRDHMVRRVYMTDTHSTNVKPQSFGESIGHYEGSDTLVIDTIGLSIKNNYIDDFRTPHSAKEHVVERYTVSSDGKRLTAAVTVDDLDSFNEPLHMIQTWHKVANPLRETVCAENNNDSMYFH